MKKIDFGFNGDSRLNASFSEIEFYNGEYLDAINCDNRDFLVTRIVDSFKGLNGSIDVREVAQDYYSDGSYVTYANKEKDELCNKLEEFLNKEMVKSKLDSERPLKVLRDAGFPVYTSHLPKMYSDYENVDDVVTSIRPEMFKKLKESKRNNLGMSMYNMTEEIQRLMDEIERLKTDSHNKNR